ncbi:hypothetical protein BDV95DRAFT_676293 [Massariosphaeria phaeospora]|uniref:DUF2461 domain-containing protein n=1 Tax=Massariosphaeria phaeospora TaxID=100035 RepID=A0A7C8MAK6_9PLEO|nr:hypothetical protein BDV95DRAFT_676293 [Massariosphaeria phaeospora]
MVRKSTKSAISSAPRSSSKRPPPEKATPTRQSKRAKATPAKSPYFDPASDEDIAESQSKSAEASNLSDYEHESGRDASTDAEEEDSNEDEDKPTKQTSRGRPAKRTTLPLHKKPANDKELWMQGAKLAPGTQLIIKKPKARDTGDTPYSDDTIHPNTMFFLADLAANNERQWLKLHDLDYRASLQDFTTFLEKLSDKVIEADETVPELPIKDIIFRIYRDVRFSKDQTPYKTHFSAAWSRTGRKGPYAAYYVQIQPGGESFVGGGLWQPDAQPLTLLRREIDRKPHKLKRVLTDARVRKAFFGGVADDATKVVKAFTNQTSNKSTALKKCPKGYDSDHKDIELLRLRSFTLGSKMSDEEVIGAKGLERIAEVIASMVPFITYLNNVVMPDDDDDDASESGSSEDTEGDNGSDDGNNGGVGEDDI